MVRGVVDGAEVLIGVDLLDEMQELGEVLGGLGLHEVVLVGEGPPDVAEGGEAGDEVADVALVDVGGHGGVAPAVVGMEEDEVGLDVEVAELGEALFEVVEEGGIEVGGVVRAGRAGFRGSREGVELGLVVVVLVGLGEDAHADLVEGRSAQGIEGLLLESVALMDPGVAGGAEGEVRRAVGVGEVVRLADGDGAVAGGGGAEEGAGAVGERGGVAGGGVGPAAFGVGHEADFVERRRRRRSRPPGWSGDRG